MNTSRRLQLKDHQTDVFVSTRSKAKINRKFDFDKLALFDYRKHMKGVMLHTEAIAVYHHLINTNLV